MKRKTTWMLMILGCVIGWVVVIAIILMMLKIIRNYWIFF